MTLFSTHTVAFPVQVAYWILRVVAPTGLVNPVSTGPETWPWDPVGWWRSMHHRVSRVLACVTSPCAKLESDRY